jgi:hypothetical protein
MPRRRSTLALEPRQSALLWVVLVHALALALLLAWAKSASTPASLISKSPHSLSPISDHPLHWLHPAAFRIDLPHPALFTTTNEPPLAPPIPEATPPPPAPSPDPNTQLQPGRFITLSRRESHSLPPSSGPETQSPPSSATDPTIDTLKQAQFYAELDHIDEAIHQAFMQVWQPPSGQALPPDKRAARLDLTLSPSLEIEEADLVTPSGSPEFDLSILNAVDQVSQLLPSLKSGQYSIKIPQNLPSTFQNLRYDCRIQFQIE